MFHVLNRGVVAAAAPHGEASWSGIGEPFARSSPNRARRESSSSVVTRDEAFPIFPKSDLSPFLPLIPPCGPQGYSV